MKKGNLVILSIIGIICLIIWFSCNPFQEGSDRTTLNVLDGQDIVKATGATVLYVSPSGTPAGAGTTSSPLNLDEAILQIAAGGTIWMMDGTYSYSTQITIDSANSGSSGSMKNLFAVNTGKATIDFSSQAYNSSDTGTNFRGLQINGNYWYVKGIKFYKSADNGLFIGGNYNKVENCVFQANRDSGLQISRMASTLTSISNWPSYNTILNCESYDNCDPATGENADGFACKLTAGYGNKFIGCISHNNCDDGWDLYTKDDTGVIGSVTLDQCIAYGNGTLTDGTATSNGDRNGFKLGGADISVVHYVTRCVAFKNGKNGFTWNSNPAAIQLSNCLAFDNVEGNFKFDSPSAAVFTNCVSIWTSGTGVNDKYATCTDVSNTNCWWQKSTSDSKPNHSVNGKGLIASVEDFANALSSATVTKNSDGSPVLSFFKLASGSDLADAGAVPSGTLPFTASSYYINTPDLGAYETK